MAQLECEVTEGLFPHEKTIYFEGVDKKHECWADADEVVLAGGNAGLIPVYIADEDRERDRVLIELSREVVMGGRRVWVRASQVRR